MHKILKFNNIYISNDKFGSTDPLIMGILNLDGQSFYLPSVVDKEADVLQYVEKMLVDGMQILDVGAMSSKPGSEILSPEVEQNRLMPILKSIRKEFEFLTLSVDTLHASTADQALNLGVQIINDISGGHFDHQMLDVVARYQCTYILMHMRGIPKNMQEPHNVAYNDLVKDIIQYFAERIHVLQNRSISQIIIDPGFGFSKTIDQNYELLNKLEYFQFLDKPLMVGLSRKSMFWKRLHTLPEEVLPASIAASSIALMKGAKIIRTHDVGAIKQAIEVFKLLKNS